MVARHSPRQQFLEAFNMAKEHNCVAVERPNLARNGGGSRYLLYRKPACPEGRLIYIGARGSIADFRRFVESVCHPRQSRGC